MINIGDKVMLKGDKKASICVAIFFNSQGYKYYYFENPHYEDRFLLTENEVKANLI